MKKLGIPVGVTMRIGPIGDCNGVSVEECGVRMAKTGADMIGLPYSNIILFRLIIFNLMLFQGSIAALTQTLV